MNETNPDKRLTRSRDDRFIGGVAAGIAEYLSVDPVLIRVAFLVSIAFGGIGVLAYLVLLAIMPIDGDPAEPTVPPSRTKRFWVIAGTIVVGCLALASIDGNGFGGWFFGIGPGPVFGALVWVLAIGGVIWLIRETTRGDNALTGAFGRPPGTRPTTPVRGPTNLNTEDKPASNPSDPDSAGSDSSTAVTTTMAASPSQTAPTEVAKAVPADRSSSPQTSMAGAGGGGLPPEPPSRRGGNPPPPAPTPHKAPSTVGRILTWCAIGVSALILFSLLGIVSLWVTAEFGAAPIAILVVLSGIGLIAATLSNRRQLAVWMLATALVLAIPMAFISIADLRIDGGYGDLNEQPGITSDIPDDGYKMAAGAMHIDMRRYPFRPGEIVNLPVKSGMGMTRVIVPDHVCVSGSVSGKAGLAEIRGVESSGVGFSRDFRPGSARVPELKLDAEFKLGYFEVIDATTWKLDGSYDGWQGGPPGRKVLTDRQRNPASVSASRQRGLTACHPQVGGKSGVGRAAGGQGQGPAKAAKS